MQCYEYELIRITLTHYIREIDPKFPVDPQEVADQLADYGIRSVTQLSDLKSIARNICARVRLAA